MTQMPSHPWNQDDPLIDVTITEPDTMSVTVVGLPYRTPVEWGALHRSDFGRAMDDIYTRWPMPLSCRITETDGTVHTGVIDHQAAPPADAPPAQGAPAVPPPPEPSDTDSGPRRTGGHRRRAPRRALVEPEQPAPPAAPALGDARVVDRLAPGETVVISVAVGRVAADDTGRVQVDLPAWLATTGSSQLVVTGVVSGRTEIMGGR